jgi:hypothetical protein
MSSEKDIQIQKIKSEKYNSFMGTIMICVAYALLAIILIAIGSFTDFGKRTIFGSLLSFTTTFIVGTVLVILITLVSVSTYRPDESITVEKSKYDNMSCPDYWKYVQTDNTDPALTYLHKNSANYPEVSSGLLDYKCIKDPQIFDNKSEALFYNNNNVDSATLRPELSKAMELMKGDATLTYSDGSDNSNKLRCDVVYPAYLANIDNNMKDGNGNDHRCEYASACGVPWTDLGCTQ